MEPHQLLFFLYCASALLALVALLQRLLRLRHRLPRLLSAFWAKLCKACDGPNHGDELGKVVSERMLQRKVAKFRMLMQLAVVPLSLAHWAVLANLLRGAELHQTATQHAVTLLSQALSTCALFWPGCITARSLDACYVAGVAASALFLSLHDIRPGMLPLALTISNSTMAALNLFHRSIAARRLPLLPIGNAVFAACAVAAILLRGPGCCDRPGQLAAWQLMATFGCAVLAHCLELGLSSTLRQSLRLQRVEELVTATRKLLRSFCDCTLELDEAGCIVSDEGLSGYLMRDVAQRPLADLVEPADREALVQGLRYPRMDAIGLAECLALSVRDGCGNVLRVELHWLAFGGDHRGFLVGVRELSGRELSGREPQAADGFDEGSARQEDDGVAMLFVDATRPGFPLRRQTEAHVAQMGRLPRGCKLSDHVVKARKFMSWVQHEALQEHPGACRLTLTTPAGKFRANCQLVLAEDTPEEAEQGLDMIGLHFTHVQPLTNRVPELRGTPGTPPSGNSSSELSFESRSAAISL